LIYQSQQEVNIAPMDLNVNVVGRMKRAGTVCTEQAKAFPEIIVIVTRSCITSHEVRILSDEYFS